MSFYISTNIYIYFFPWYSKLRIHSKCAGLQNYDIVRIILSYVLLRLILHITLFYYSLACRQGPRALHLIFIIICLYRFISRVIFSIHRYTRVTFVALSRRFPCAPVRHLLAVISTPVLSFMMECTYLLLNHISALSPRLAPLTSHRIFVSLHYIPVRKPSGRSLAESVCARAVSASIMRCGCWMLSNLQTAV